VEGRNQTTGLAKNYKEQKRKEIYRARKVLLALFHKGAATGNEKRRSIEFSLGWEWIFIQAALSISVLKIVVPAAREPLNTYEICV